MHIELRVRPLLPAAELSPRLYDPDDDDVRSIVMDLCGALDESADFLIAGFGQARWPVDVRTDLAVFLEQLPDAVQALRARQAAVIDLYEQGIERTLEFLPPGDRCAVRCISRTDWAPDPEVEELDITALDDMLLAVRDEFLKVLAQLAPSVVGHPWIAGWRQAMD
ncbi:hypothetical protein [Variovorax boronicumulans]|uniref:hypothetical protein n=1 Tax=Variovorax boronicumulans TaxID=436515 RepID=UPI003399C768